MKQKEIPESVKWSTIVIVAQECVTLVSTCINWLTNFLGNSRGIGAENGPFCSFFLRTSRAFISDEKLLFFSCFLHGSMLKVKFSSLLYSFRASRFNDYAVKSDRTSRRKKTC